MHYREGTIDDAPIVINIAWKKDDGSFVMPSTTNPLPVTIASGSSNGTEYVEDVARPVAVSAPSLNMIRDDVLSTVTPVENDWIPIRGDDKGALWVHDLNSTAILSAVDGIEALLGTSNTNTGATATSAASIDTKTPALGQALAAASTPVVLTAAQISTLTPPAAITGYATETTLSSALTSLQLIDDAIFAQDAATAGGQKGVSMLARQTASPANVAGTDGDYEWLQMSGGRLWVDASGKSLTVASHAVTNAGTFAVQVDGAALTSLQLIDDAIYAEDTASQNLDKGVMILARRTATPANTSNTDLDYESLQMSAGRLWVDPSGVTLTVGSHAVTVASGGIASGAVAAGAYASGAFASGAFASGSVASGAFASGSIAAGAIATGATSIAANEDDPSANLDTGVKILAIQKSSPADTAGTDADYAMLQMSGGRLWVDASGKTLTVGSHAITIASGGVASGAIASGAIASGAVASGAFASGSIAAGAVTAGPTSFVKLEDAANADADAGVPSMMVRKATPANLSGTDGDYEFLQGSAGRLWVDASGVTLTVASHAVTNAGTFVVQENGGSLTALQIMDDWDNAGSDGASVTGDVAHDSADAGEPVKIGGKAVSAEPTAVTANDRVNSIFDLVGKQIVLPYANPENFVSGTTSAMTGTTSTSLVAAPASGLRNYITTIIVSNAHATVGTDIVIQDGSGGTTLLTIPAAAVYGGAVITLPTPLRQPTTATALFCANVTTGASTKVSAVGYKGA